MKSPKLNFTAASIILALTACESKKDSKAALKPVETAPAASAPTESAPAPSATGNEASAAPTEGQPGTDATAAQPSTPEKPEKSTTKPEGPTSDIEGTWISGCREVGDSFSERVTFDYSDGTEIHRTEMFSGKRCKDAYLTTVQKNTVALGAPVEGVPHARAFVRTIGRTKATPQSDAAAASLGASWDLDPHAESVGWSVGESKDVTNARDLGRVEKNILKVEDEMLFFGEKDEHGMPRGFSSEGYLKQTQ